MTPTGQGRRRAAPILVIVVLCRPGMVRWSVAHRFCCGSQGPLYVA